MKFAVDAHLPPRLCDLLEAAGHDAVHTRDLGNIRTRDLAALFDRHLPEIIAALEQNSLVELDWQAVRIVI